MDYRKSWPKSRGLRLDFTSEFRIAAFKKMRPFSGISDFPETRPACSINNRRDKGRQV